MNAELAWAGLPVLDNEVIDTVMLARKKHPGARVSLDALCKHYGIDNSAARSTAPSSIARFWLKSISS